MITPANLKVFVVDDDPICREMYAQYLLNMGVVDIRMFDNGQQCINELTQSPDVILLDHHMTPIDGLETLKKIKRFNPDIYLIFISAQEKMQVAINALKYGAFDYVIKGDGEEPALTGVMNKILDVMEQLGRQTSGKWNKFRSLFSL